MFLCLQVRIEELVAAMGGVLLSKHSTDVNFVIVKDVLAAKYKVSYAKFLKSLLVQLRLMLYEMFYLLIIFFFYIVFY